MRLLSQELQLLIIIPEREGLSCYVIQLSNMRLLLPGNGAVNIQYSAYMLTYYIISGFLLINDSSNILLDDTI